MTELRTDDTAARIRCVPELAGARLDLSGDIDMACKDRFAPALAEVAAAPRGDVSVHLADVTFLSSDGLGFLISLNNQVTATGHRMVLVAPPHCVTRVLDLTGLNELFTIKSGS